MSFNQLYITAIIAASVALSSCSGNKTDDAATYDVTADVSIDPDATPATPAGAPASRPSQPSPNTPTGDADPDSKPYQLGRRHAADMLQQCRTQDEIRDRLLDINARTTNIRRRIGAEAADNYLQGFRSYLTERGDTLANAIF